MAIDEPPFDFITDIRRFLFLNHGLLHAATFLFAAVFARCFFHGLVSVLYTRRPRPANNAIAATELTSNFLPFGANKNILIQRERVN